MQLRAPLVSISLAAALGCVTLVPASAQIIAALSGQVSSAAEATMEGVLVSAKREGTTITVTVASDATGRFSFPAARLEAARYTLAIRAVGYELDGSKTADVISGAATTVD